MTATTQAARVRPAADPVSEDIFGAGVLAGKAARMRPMSPEAAARLVPVISASLRENDQNGGTR